MVVAAGVVVAWMVGQAWSWGRADPEQRPGLDEHLGRRLSREWPLLAILLAPLGVRAWPWEALRWVFAALGAIAVWWLSRRLGALQQTMGPTRDPLRCARLAARRLKRNRWLLAPSSCSGWPRG